MNSSIIRTRPLLLASLLLTVLLSFTACRTVQQTSVVSWREAVQATKDQSRVTFQTVGLLIRESQLKRIETLPPDQLRQISESDLTSGLPAQALRQWNVALDAMAAYASSVETLLSPDLPKDVGDSLQRTGEQIGATADVEVLKSDKELSKAIGALGRQIVAAAANRKAREVMLQVDPSVKQLTDRMANMLYTARPGTDEDGKPITKESGVLPTIRVTWDDKTTAVQEKFRNTADSPVRRALAEQYADLLDQRGELEDSIMALRRSLLDLSAAHTAAAQGRAADLRTLIASMREDIALVSAIAASLKKNKN
jgi:hypothetical protein